MPVDLPRVNYYPDSNGRDTILNDRGEIVKGWIGDTADSKTLKGHKPHFVSCNGYKKDHPDKDNLKAKKQISMFEETDEQKNMKPHTLRLTDHDTVSEIVNKMSDGHAGCYDFLKQLVIKSKYGGTHGGVKHVYLLDELGIYGARAYIFWNDICTRNINEVELVLANIIAGEVSVAEIHMHIDSGYASPLQHLSTFEELGLKPS